jgi:hypothetical protein
MRNAITTFATAASSSPIRVPSPTLPALNEASAREVLAREGPDERPQQQAGDPEEDAMKPPRAAPASASGLAPTRFAPRSDAATSAINESTASATMIESAIAPTCWKPSAHAARNSPPKTSRIPGSTGSIVPARPRRTSTAAMTMNPQAVDATSVTDDSVLASYSSG